MENFLEHMVAYTDGASQCRIKRAGIGIVFYYPTQMIRTTDGKSLKFNEKPCSEYHEEIFSNRSNVEYPTNNDAEYISLIKAMVIAISKKCKKITVFMDSKLVVNQVSGVWNINHDHLRKYINKIDKLKQKILLKIYHIKREYNKWADHYSKVSIDENTPYMDKKFKI